MSSDRIGTRLGEYRIESMLGRGGMSVVYLAEHERLKRKAARCATSRRPTWKV